MKYFTVLAAFLILGSCQKKGSDIKATEVPINQGQGAPVPPGPDPAIPPAPPAPEPPAPAPPVPSALPVLSFGYGEYVYDGENEIHVELVLSQPSTVPVTVDVELVDGTALYARDYAGFLSGGSDRKQSVILAPQQTRIDIPFIYIKNNSGCGTEFSAHLTSVQQAVISGDSTRIVLNCP